MLYCVRDRLAIFRAEKLQHDINHLRGLQLDRVSSFIDVYFKNPQKCVVFPIIMSSSNTRNGFLSFVMVLL